MLFEEVMEALQPRAGGGGYLAVDCTTNGGGHSAGLLERSSPDGRLVGLDADAGALELAAARLAPYQGRFTLVPRNFRYLGEVAAELGVADVDGVVLDLGLSSVQLDQSGRGFSFRFDEPLDMRFDTRAGTQTAADLLNELAEDELVRVFIEYGEEPRARRVAGAVVRQRVTKPFARTTDLVEAATRALGPKQGRIHPATRVFQALRIAVNDELGALEEGLAAAVTLLRPGGRLAVISFHSLEDRIVKWRFRAWAESARASESNPPGRLDLPAQVRGVESDQPLVRILTKRPITPSETELAANPRARSAKLRVAERLPSLAGAPANLSIN